MFEGILELRLVGLLVAQTAKIINHGKESYKFN